MDYRFIHYGKFHQPKLIAQNCFFMDESKISNLKIESKHFLSLEMLNRQKKYFFKIISKIGHRENGFSAVFATLSSQGIHAPEPEGPRSCVVRAYRSIFSDSDRTAPRLINLETKKSPNGAWIPDSAIELMERLDRRRNSFAQDRILQESGRPKKTYFQWRA